MRRLVVGLTTLIAGIIVLLALSGFTPVYLMNAPAVGAGMGAKLLCSARFVSRYSEQQSFSDLVQYSPLLEFLNVNYDENNRRVSASLLGLGSKSASLVPGLGCAIDYSGFTERAQVQAQNGIEPEGILFEKDNFYEMTASSRLT